MTCLRHNLLLAALSVGASHCSATALTSVRGEDAGSGDPAADSGAPPSGGDAAASGNVVGREPGPTGKDAGPMNPDPADAAPVGPGACAARTMPRPRPE